MICRSALSPSPQRASRDAERAAEVAEVVVVAGARDRVEQRRDRLGKVLVDVGVRPDLRVGRGPGSPSCPVPGSDPGVVMGRDLDDPEVPGAIHRPLDVLRVAEGSSIASAVRASVRSSVVRSGARRGSSICSPAPQTPAVWRRVRSQPAGILRPDTSWPRPDPRSIRRASRRRCPGDSVNSTPETPRRSAAGR